MPENTYLPQINNCATVVIPCMFRYTIVHLNGGSERYENSKFDLCTYEGVRTKPRLSHFNFFLKQNGRLCPQNWLFL